MCAILVGEVTYQMTTKITDTIVLEVTGVDRKTYYPNEYAKPAETQTFITLSTGRDTLRTATISIPGNLPLGTRFKLTVEQIDDVTSATIHRGALPIIEDRKLIEGDGGVQ